MKHQALLGITALIVTFLGATLEAEDKKDAPKPGTGILRGRVVYTGKRPPPKSVRIPEFGIVGGKFCRARGKIPDETALVDEKGGLANTVILIDESHELPAPKPKKVVVRLEGCRFEPHVTIAPTGSTLRVETSDDILHYPNGRRVLLFESEVSKKKPYTHPKKLERTGVVDLRCSFQPWEKGRLHIVQNDFVAVSAKDGSFEIRDIPPGTYRFEIRHERYADKVFGRSIRKEFTIHAGKVTDARIEVKNQTRSQRPRPKRAAKKTASAKPKTGHGHLVGRVVLEGPPPKFASKVDGPPINNKDYDYCTRSTAEWDERFLMGKNRGIEHAVVAISDKHEFETPATVKPNEIDIEDRLFVPHISAMTVGSSARLTTSDAVIHNPQLVLGLKRCSAVSLNKPFVTAPARKPGVAILACSFHTWGQAPAHIRNASRWLGDRDSPRDARTVQRKEAPASEGAHPFR